MRKLKHLPIEQWPVDDVLWSFLMPFRVTNRSNPQLDRWLRSTTEVSAEQHREAWGTGSVAPASEESAGPKHRPHLQEERDLCEGHALEEPGRVFLIAANAIKSFGINAIEGASSGILHEKLDPWPKEGRARYRAIAVNLHKVVPIALQALAAQTHKTILSQCLKSFLLVKYGELFLI